MGAILFIAAATLCLYLLRGAWRLLVEVPDVDQVWVPDLVDDFLTRSLSAALLAGSGLFLVLMAQAAG
jgi:hypothetical protein